MRGRGRGRIGLVAVALAAVAAGAGLAGCGDIASSPADPGAPRVVATTTQLGDLVRAVGGRAAAVTQILQPNSDPHEYEPRPSDARALRDARIVFESGDGLDAWAGKLIGQSGGHPRVVSLGDALPAAARRDPHWWHDPRNVEAAIPVIERALAAAAPSRAATYARNARAELAKVRRLDAGIARCVAAVPAARRKLVTDHDAFGAFARRYGIEVIGAVIPAQTTEAQPSAGDVARLVGVIRREHVKAVFPESSVSPKLAQAIARETGATAGEQLYGDTLGPAGSDGATYVTMERHNADAIVRGFTGGARGCAIPGL